LAPLSPATKIPFQTRIGQADRKSYATEVLRDGMTVQSQTGSLRPHPALAVFESRLLTGAVFV
jgi:hypothetical protein